MEVKVKVNGHGRLREAFVFIDGVVAAIVRQIGDDVWCHTCSDNCTTHVRETFEETLGELVALTAE